MTCSPSHPTSRHKTLDVRFSLAVVAGTLAVAAPAPAAIVVDPNGVGATDITTLSGAPSDPTLGGLPNIPIVVGYDAHGEIRVDNAGSPPSLTTNTAIIGNKPGSTGRATIRGGTWNTGSAALIVGRDGDGSLLIENGGLTSSGFGSIGQRAGSTGRVDVTGPLSGWLLANNLSVGALGQGEMTIADGAAVNVAGSTNISSTGTLELTTGAMFNAGGSVSVSGGTLDAGVNTMFNLADNQLFTASDQALVTFGNRYAVDRGVTLRVQSGADFTTGTYLDVANGTTGTLLVEGAGTTLNTSSVSLWGGSNGTADITIRDQAVANLGTLLLANDNTPDTVTDWRIESGAKVSAASVAIGAGRGTSTLEMSGSGTELNLSETGSLTVGHTSIGAGLLTVSDGAVLSTGGNATNINATGTLRIEDGGVFDANAVVNVNSGRFVRDSTGVFRLADGKGFYVSNGGTAEFAGGHHIEEGHSYFVQTGSELSASNYLDIGDSSDGSLLVNHAGSKLTAGAHSFWGKRGGSARINFANQAQGELGRVDFGDGGAESEWNVSSGAQVSSGTITISPTGTGTAELTVTQAGSALSQSPTSILHIGTDNGGTATVNVRDDGAFTTGVGTTLIRSGGALNVANGGTFSANGNVQLNGGRLTVDQANLDLATDTALRAVDDSTIDFIGSYVIKNGATFDIRTGSDLSVTGGLSVATDGTDGTLLVDGNGSSVTASNGISIFGAAGGNAQFTASNGAEAEFENVQLSLGTNAATQSTWNVLNGADVTIESFAIATDRGSANVTIGGGGATLTQVGDSSLTLGTNGFNTLNATLYIDDGGTLNTGTGATTINEGGWLRLEGGNLNATTIDHTHGGDLDFTAGTLVVTEFQGSLTQDGGTLEAGGTAGGLTTITGDYAFNAGTLTFDLGGDPGSAETDQLLVQGTAALGTNATLQISLNNAFAPDPNDEFLVFTAQNLAGGFDNAANGERIDTLGGGGSFVVNYGVLSPFAQNLVVLSDFLALAVLTGDYNGSGQVEQADLDLVLQNWGRNTDLAGIPSGWVSDLPTGLVDQAELDGVLQNWGGSSAPKFRVAAVPEPASLALLGLGALAMLPRRR